MANRSQILTEINRMKNEGQDTIRRDYLKKLYEYQEIPRLYILAHSLASFPEYLGTFCRLVLMIFKDL